MEAQNVGHVGRSKFLADKKDELVCWSRMQAEAGQALEAIVARKERERQAGNGLFCWGVGNAPATITCTLARMGTPVGVVFSIMKTRPKAIDSAPSRTVAWRCFIDAYGVERSLPSHMLVTSRGDSPSGAKKSHYALICRSDSPLQLQRGEPFDPSAYRNAGGTGAPVGASQVTALLRLATQTSNRTDYSANMRARLAADYWVRLTDPIELTTEKINMLASEPASGSESWISFVAHLRSGPSCDITQVEKQVLLI